jgi:hypothetical protein
MAKIVNIKGYYYIISNVDENYNNYSCPHFEPPDVELAGFGNDSNTVCDCRSCPIDDHRNKWKEICSQTRERIIKKYLQKKESIEEILKL